MTVPVPDQLEYISDADGVTKDFSYPKRFLQKDEIVVLLRDANGVDTPQILNTHYTIAGSSWPSGGTISFINAPQAPNKVVRYRMTQAKQTVDLENNQRNDAPSVELQLDRLTMAIQDRGRLGDSAWWGLLAEIAARVQGDKLLNDRVDQEIIDRTNGDEALASLIGQAGPIEVPMFDTRLAVTFANIKPSINAIRTSGYTNAGDGGGALYKRALTEPTHAGKIQSADGQWWELAENVPALEMFGAKGDGVTDDTAARDEAINYVGINGRINLLDGKTYLVSNNDNAASVRFEGRGQLVTTVAGGLRQRNTYAENARIAIGQEYLERIYTYFDVSRIVGPFIIRIFGDSTATEGYGAHTPYEIISRNFAERGIGRYTLYNQAVAGHTWEDLDLISNLDGVTALAFLKFGINDATQGGGTIEQRLMHMRSVMDAKLSAIRSHPNGSQGAISLALIGPTTVSNSPVGCDERWMERCRDIYIEMARKHKCFYFDSYAFMLDARDGASGLYLDDPYGDGRGVHPWGQFNNRLWGAILEAAFPRSSTVNYASNIFTNNGSVGAPLSAGTPPEFFLEGIALDRATPTNLWPIDGYVQSTKNVDGGVLQELFNYGTYPIVRRRVANQLAGVFSPWEGTPVAVSPGVGFTLSATPNQAGVARTGMFCMGCGALDFTAETVMSAASQVCYLPQDFLPYGDYQGICLVVFNVNNNFSEVIPAQIVADGTVRTLKNTSAAVTTVFLGGVNYLAAT